MMFRVLNGQDNYSVKSTEGAEITTYSDLMWQSRIVRLLKGAARSSKVDLLENVCKEYKLPKDEKVFEAAIKRLKDLQYVTVDETSQTVEYLP